MNSMKHPISPQKKRLTPGEKFLGEMERVVPWARLEALIEPKYPTSRRVGRQPIGVPRMLRMYFLQQWFGLADEAVEDAIHDSQAMRNFVGIDLSHETVPDATTLLNVSPSARSARADSATVRGYQRAPERTRLAAA